MNEIAKYNSQISWYAPLTRINLGIHGMRSLVLQGTLLTITSLALAIILTQNGSFAAAFANQKVALAILLTIVGLQCIKLGINSYTYNRKKNIRESVKAEIDILLPSTAIIAKDPKHPYSKFSGNLKSLVAEYVGFQDLKTVCYLMNEFDCALPNYQNYWKQRTGVTSWEDIRTVFTDLGIALKENRDKSEDECGLIERLSSFDSTDNMRYFAKFFWDWECLSKTCEPRIEKHLPILTRYFTHDPKRVSPGNLALTYGRDPYTKDIMENSNEELVELAFQRGMLSGHYFLHACSSNEKTALFVFRNHVKDPFSHMLPIVCMHGCAELLEKFIQLNPNLDLHNWNCLDDAMLGALFQRKILTNKTIPRGLYTSFRWHTHFNHIKMSVIKKGNYAKIIKLLIQNGENIHSDRLLGMSPLEFARKHPELEEYIPILEGREVV